MAIGLSSQRAPATTTRDDRCRGSEAAAPVTSVAVKGDPSTIRPAAVIVGSLTASVLLVALVTRATLAGQARGWLHYAFPGVPARWDVAVGIFAHNGRAILGVFGLLLISQLAARHPDGPGRAQRSILAAGELILAGVILANVLVVGAGLGAYGERMAQAELPHGPVELAAYSLALSLYLEGRKRALSAARLTKVAAASVALLAIAAALETFVSL